jgi:hypothetical protein
VTARSFDRLVTRSGWTTGAGRAAVADAVDRVIDRWGLLADHLPKAVVQRLTERRDALPLLREH